MQATLASVGSKCARIMPLTISPERAIRFTKFSVALSCSWPPRLNSSKLALTIHQLLWHMSFVSTLLLFFPLVRSSYEYRDNPIVMAQSVCLACAVVQITIKMMLCRMQRFRFQALIFEMESFCASANDEEKNVLQCYIDRYKLMHGLYTFSSYFTSVLVICGPLILPQSFPTYALYPFSVDKHPTKEIVYFHQSLVGLQASAGMNIDCQVAILIWFATARFEMLGQRIRNISHDDEFEECVRNHQKILRFAREVQETVRFLALTTTATTTVGVAFGSLNLIGPQPVTVKTQYIVVILIASIELFICALPADHLMNTSFKVSYDMYNSNWYERSVQVQKIALQLIMRAQKAESIRINGVLPTLSLSYYSSFLYTSFSYFTAIRVMVERDEME